ncbi:MAG: 5-formyltetrahydrofolate cyclo-ligase [Candidatus Omnitrophota bacterium]
MKKQTLRKIMRKRLKNQKEVYRRKKSGIIKNKLFKLNEFKKAKTVMLYASFDGEVDTFKMIKGAIKEGKTVILPAIAKRKKRLIPRAIETLRDLEKGPFGILEPRKACSRVISKKNLDLVIVPGLAFDKENFRLGRGLGFYDRFLAGLPRKTQAIGLCFDFQIVSSVPRFSSDLPVSKVISA